MLERQQPGLLNPVNFPGLLNPVGAAVRGIISPAVQFQPTIEWFFADKGSGQVDTANTFGATPTFTRATTATTIGPTGLVTSVGSGVPRSYYDPTSLAYLGYLAEGARTNLCLQSEDFATTWNTTEAGTNATISVNAAVAPDGATTADQLVEDTDNAQHFTNQTFTKAASAITYSVSVFLKPAGRSFAAVRLDDGSTDGNRANFSLSGAGSVGAIDVVGAGFTSPSSSITAYPNGWYRCVITATSDTDTSLRIIIQSASALGTITYAGNDSSGIYMWGAQLEAASFASSYIPTTTAAVTRNADVLTYPTAGWLSASGGIQYISGLPQQISAVAGWLSFDDGTASNRVDIASLTNGNFSPAVLSGGVVQANITTAGYAIGTEFRFVQAFAANDFATCNNAGTVGTDTSGSLPTVTTARIGIDTASRNAFGPIRRVAYFNKRLSNQHLQILTTS